MGSTRSCLNTLMIPSKKPFKGDCFEKILQIYNQQVVIHERFKVYATAVINFWREWVGFETEKRAKLLNKMFNNFNV